MPSLDHEAFIHLFRNKPRLVAEVLRAAFDLRLPDATGKPVESTLGEVVPTEYRADLVVAFGDARVIVEVQLGKADRKRWAWPAYAVTLRAREQCDVFLLVVTNSVEVARWAREPILLGNPGSTFIPLVLGPESCPRITDVEVARQHPELAVLSAILHSGVEPNRETLVAALEGAVQLGGDQGRLYADLLLRAAGPLLQQLKEAFMSTSHGYEFMSDFAKEHWAKGREEGREEGRRERLDEVRAASTAEAVIKVLAARGLPLGDDDRETILATADLALLDRWLVQAATASSIDELLRTAPPLTP